MAFPIYSMFALFVLIQSAYGNGVVLVNDPNTIQTILTQKMHMECSINTTNGGDLQFVTSMVVQRDGTEVASITPFSPVVAHLDLGKINVTGDVSMKNGALGHLTLMWTYPDISQSGNYTCEVNGVNSVGHPVSFSAATHVSVRQPTLNDITTHVRDQQIILDKHQADNQYLMAQSALHKADLNVLQMNMKAQQQEMAIVNQSTTQIQNKMATVMAMLDETRQVDNGTVICGDSNSWTDVGSFREVEVTTSFNTSYGKPPIVHASANHISNYNKNANFRYSLKYWIDLVDINESNFTLRCRTDGDVSTGYLRMYELDVSWFSIGSYQ